MKEQQIYSLKNNKILYNKKQELEQRGESIRKQITKLRENISKEAASYRPLLQNTIAYHKTLYADVRQKIYLLKEKILNSQEFEIFELLLKGPIKPNKALNISVSTVIGLILRVLIVFIKEFLKTDNILIV